MARVHGVEVDRRRLLVVLVERGLAREEEDARHGRGHGALEHGDGEVRDLGGRGLGPVDAVLDHVGLEDRALEVTAVAFLVIFIFFFLFNFWLWWLVTLKV